MSGMLDEILSFCKCEGSVLFVIVLGIVIQGPDTGFTSDSELTKVQGSFLKS